MPNKPTPCPNCGRDSFIDLCCPDCTKAYNKGEQFQYVKQQVLIKKAKQEERQRIINWIRNQNPAFGQKMTTLNNENAYLIIESELAELEKGDA